MTGQVSFDYRVLKQLGGDEMAVVYRAEDAAPGQFVTLKFLPEEFPRDLQEFEHFQHEARAAAGIT